MNLLRLVVLVTALFCAVQATAAADEKWRPVTPEEIAMTVGKVDPNADAEAIFWEVRIDAGFDYKLIRDHYVRVKIFNERGREQLAKLDLVSDFFGQKYEDIRGRVVRRDGTFAELGKNDIIEREVVRFNGEKVRGYALVFPNLEPGVIVEYHYREVIERGTADGEKVFLSKDVPVQVLRYFYRTIEQDEPSYSAYNIESVDFVKASDGFYVLEQKNVPAFKTEPFMTPERNNRPWLRLPR